MPKVLLVFLFILATFLFSLPNKASAINECPNGYYGEVKAIDSKGDPNLCPAESYCYVKLPGSIPETYGCYKEKESSAPLSVPANVGGGETAPPTTSPGVTCSVSPKSINRGDVLKFTASGLEPNKQYRLIIRNNTFVGFVSSNSLGKIETIFNPLSADNTIGSTGDTSSGAFTVSLHKPPSVLMCRSESISITNVLDPNKKYFTCDKASKACIETTDLASSVTEDKEACDKACAEEGKTYSSIKSSIVTCKSRNDPTFVAGTDPVCTEAAGQICENGQQGIETAIGCVPTEPQALISGILRFVTGAAGGIALLLMAFGAIRMITSAGSPEALKGGQEQFTAAIIGLLFIIFSVLLLKIIGVDILGLGAYF